MILLVATVLVVLFYITLMNVKRDSQARESPPDARYQGALVEVPKLSECLSARAPQEDFQWMHDAGVRQVEMIKTNLSYASCLLNSKHQCGWFSEKQMEVRDQEGEVILAYGNLHFSPAYLFGVRLVLEPDGVRALVPHSVAGPHTDFGSFCELAAQAFVVRSIDALSWQPKSD